MNKNKKQMPLQNGEELKPIMIKPNMGRMIKPMAKFPDLSGDGKVTQKDILMGRGVIKKPKMEGGKFMTKQYSKTRRNMSKAGEKAFEKARTDAAIAIGSSIPIGRVASGLARASRLKRIPGFQPSLKQQQKEKMIKAFAEFTKPKVQKTKANIMKGVTISATDPKNDLLKEAKRQGTIASRLYKQGDIKGAKAAKKLSLMSVKQAADIDRSRIASGKQKRQSFRY